MGGPLVRLAASTRSAELKELSPGAGPGAGRVLEVYWSALKGLGMPELPLWVTPRGPPFALMYFSGPALAVSRAAVNEPMEEGLLRFYAGRALFSQAPDLWALRTLTARPEQSK